MLKSLSIIKLSIEHRESQIKFTKVINLIFYEIDKIGKRFKIEQNNKKFIDIFDIIKLYTIKITTLRNLFTKILKNKFDYEFNNSIILPNNILNSKDIFSYGKK